MSSIEESVVTAMDGADKELFPYLPYILQDLWEIGASPEVILKLIKKHAQHDADLKVLDLGCGKGAVSIRLAKALNCSCFGIDAVPEFIDFARLKAKEYGVDDRCRFKVCDIRTQVSAWKGYDFIILGAIGPVFGNYYQTLTTLSGCLNAGGGIIIDDAFIDDASDFIHAVTEKKSSILSQIQQAGMILVDEYIIQEDELRDSDAVIFKSIEQRCHELIIRYPEKRLLFENYINQQREENEVLENKVHCTTMLIKKRGTARGTDACVNEKDDQRSKNVQF